MWPCQGTHVTNWKRGACVRVSAKRRISAGRSSGRKPRQGTIRMSQPPECNYAMQPTSRIAVPCVWHSTLITLFIVHLLERLSRSCLLRCPRNQSTWLCLCVHAGQQQQLPTLDEAALLRELNGSPGSSAAAAAELAAVLQADDALGCGGGATLTTSSWDGVRDITGVHVCVCVCVCE
jgi:hypothetical protein